MNATNQEGIHCQDTTTWPISHESLPLMNKIFFAKFYLVGFVHAQIQLHASFHEASHVYDCNSVELGVGGMSILIK